MSQRVLIVCLTLILLISARSSAQDNPYDNEIHMVKVVFHLIGADPISWDGKVEVTGGQLLEMKGWCFDAKDKAEGNRWQCTVEEKLRRPKPGERRNRQRADVLVDFAEPEKGLFLALRGRGDTAVRLQTNRGDLSFSISELVLGRDKSLADGLVTVSRGIPSVKVAGEGSDDDFARVATDGIGNLWVAWISWNQQDDEVLIRKFDGKTWAQPMRVSEGRGQAFDTQIACDNLGKIWVVWVWFDFDKEQYDLFARPFDNGAPSQIVRLTNDSAPDMHPAVATAPDGAVWLAWQSIREGNSDIFLKSFKDGRWSEEIRVSENAANDWEPAIAGGGDGAVFVAWDSYRNGNYDVFLRCRRSGKWSEAIAVTTSPDFEAHASIVCDGQGRVWAAWEQGTPNWGKDYSSHKASFPAPPNSAPMHAYRRMGMACVRDGQVYEVSPSIPQPMEPFATEKVAYEALGPKRFYDRPHLAMDGDGRLWNFFRLNRQGYVGHPVTGGVWEIYGTYFSEGKWSDPLPVANSAGRMDQRLDSFLDPSGRLAIAWATGSHFKGVRYDVHAAVVPKVPGAVADAPIGGAAVLPAPGAPDEKVPRHSAKVGGKEYQLFYGDLHRHTEISLCTPTIDGSLTDAYRYALDTAQLGFLGITDHTRDTRPYAWWLTQKTADMFHMPGRFITFYSYERSNGVPGGGHRNVFFTKRGNPVFDAGPDPWMLWKQLADLGQSVITIPHTPAYDAAIEKGTWTYNDPRFEPLAEIFQAYRKSYEMADPERQKKGATEKWSLWHALEKGYRLGFIASSDHWSTHLSYACAYAEAPTRQSIFDALRKRRTYAAMDNIIVEFSINGHVMGEEIRLNEAPVIDVKIKGTAPIKHVDIVRDNAFIHTINPGGKTAEFSFVDKDLRPGTSYYYVRMEQEDGKWAWASPIWVAVGE